MTLQTILAPVDFSDVTPQVTKAAAEMARAFGGKVILLHVAEPEPDFVGFEPGPQAVRSVVARDFRKEHHQLETLKETLAASGLETVALQIQGPLSAKILEEADANGAGMIVIGSHGHGSLYNLLVGSVTSGVLKGAKCPVLVVPAARPPQA